MFKNQHALISNLANLLLLCNFSCILHNFPVVCNIDGNLILRTACCPRWNVGMWCRLMSCLSLCPRETLIEVLSVHFTFRAKDLGLGKFVGRKNVVI